MDREVIRRRDLPHWDVPGAACFVTTCLDGSIPAQGLLEVSRFRAEFDGQLRLASMSEPEWQVRRWKKTFVYLEEWLDIRPANRVLERAELAQIVVDSMRYFAEDRYDLYAFVVMPSHVHWLFQPREEWAATLNADDRRTPRERITYSLNRYTARRCNEILNKHGVFWQHESFDHWVRDTDELDRIIRYIEENPVKAGLSTAPENWPFSSAFERNHLRLEWGVPIPNNKRRSDS